MKKLSQLISAIVTLALGILFVIMKDGVVGVCLTVFGAALIVTAVLELIKLSIVSGIFKALLGIVVLVLGWMLIDVALLILGIVLLVLGLSKLLKRIFGKKSGMKPWVVVLGFIEPVLCVIAAVFLITSRGTAISLTVTVSGIFLIINGALGVIGALARKNKR